MRAENRLNSTRPKRTWIFACAAVCLCLTLGLAMVLNTQMGGESMWFYYVYAFRHGVKLYSDLNIPLQPLFILENDLWAHLLGGTNIAVQLPSGVHILILAFACVFIARESPWGDFEQAVMAAVGFMLVVFGHSYRFDDYHILSESFILYAIWTLLVISRTELARTRLLLVAALGVLTGFTFTTRNTDGAALAVSAGFALLFLLPRRRIVTLAMYFGVTSLVILAVVHLTGDSFSVYLSKTLFRAAQSKGGTGTIASAPLHMFVNSFPPLLHMVKRVIIALALMVFVGWAVNRYAPRLKKYLVPLQVVFYLFIISFAVGGHSPLLVPPHVWLGGQFILATVLMTSVLLYLLAPAALIHFGYAKLQHESWDCREILFVVPLAEWASYSASSGGQPLLDYYAPIAEALLLLAVLAPFRRSDSWVRPSYIAWAILLCFTTVTAKAITPYSWQNYHYAPMFENRTWYQHPIRGEMYIDRDLLNFSLQVCKDIGETGFDQGQLGTPRPELLSLPYSFPNYFCDTPPWHNYVQTWFDISTKETIDQMMQQLETAPPQWIVYQRQLNIMDGVERFYNHGRPVPHRYLDHLIMGKIQSGQWQVVDRSQYLKQPGVMSDATHDPTGEDWFIIRTHP